MKVSLIATVKDARPFVEEFLASLDRQSRPPDEVVIVDGGSTDGTWQVLLGAPHIQALSEPEANIARGRNVAVRAATHDMVAVTDADCVLAPDWLENLLQPLEGGADVSAGFYRPIADTFLQMCAAAVSVREEDELGPGWMPSSRSVAFRRDAFEAAGGYPEWLDVGEDMYLNHRWVESGARIELAPQAVVYWRIRPTLSATWRQYAGYAEGDATSGMYPHRHLIRFGAYAFGLAAVFARPRWPRALALLASSAYGATPIRRAWRRIPPGSADRWRSLVAVPAMLAFVDAAKMWGYLRGLALRARPRQ